MKHRLIALLAALIASYANLAADEDTIRPSIIGGSDAASGAYPWMIALVSNDGSSVKDGQFCGGILIHPSWVLTAAHCVEDMMQGEFLIAVGGGDLSGEHRLIKPRAILTSPENHPTRLERGCELALIQLEEPLLDVLPVPINRALSRAQNATQGKILGWGQTAWDFDGDTSPNLLQEAAVSLKQIEGYPDDHPVRSYYLVSEDVAPLRGTGGGDSGGPLLIRSSDDGSWIAAGISSYGVVVPEDSIAESYFSNIAVARDWIDSIVFPSFGRAQEQAFSDRVQVGISQDDADYVGYRIWPFANGSRETLSFRDFASYQTNEIYRFDLNQPHTYRYNGDGSFLALDKLILGVRALATPTSIAKFERTGEANFHNTLLSATPFTPVIGSYSGTGRSHRQNSALYNLVGLEPGFDYEIGYWTDYYTNVRLFEVLGADVKKVEDRQGYSSYEPIRFTPTSGASYWLEISNPYDWSEDYSLYVKPSPRGSFSFEQPYDGASHPLSHRYRGEGSYADLLEFDSLDYQEVEITLYSEFDAEMVFRLKQGGELIGYEDQAAEFENETYIMSGIDLFDSDMLITNFDKAVYGSYSISATPHDEPVFELGESLTYGITSHDDSYQDDEGYDNYYESFEFTNSSDYAYYLVDVYGHYFEPAVVVFDVDGEILASSYDSRWPEIDFEAEPGAKYEILVVDFYGPKNRNFEISVSGTNTKPTREPRDGTAPTRAPSGKIDKAPAPARSASSRDEASLKRALEAFIQQRRS